MDSDMTTPDPNETKEGIESEIAKRLRHLETLDRENEEGTDPILKSLRKKLKSFGGGS